MAKIAKLKPRPRKLFDGLMRVRYFDFEDGRIHRANDLLRVRELVPRRGSIGTRHTEVVYKSCKGTKKECKFYTQEREAILERYQDYMKTALAYVKGYPGPVFAAVGVSSKQRVQDLFEENELRGVLVTTKNERPEPFDDSDSPAFLKNPPWVVFREALSVLGVERITLIGELYRRRWWQIMYGSGCVAGARRGLSGFSTSIEK